VAAVRPSDYEETQVAHLCGLHALNHILQEKKCVWIPNKPLLINKATGLAAARTANAKDAAVQINCWALCKDAGMRLIEGQRDEYIGDEMRRIRRQLAAEPTLRDEYYTRNGAKYAKDFDRDLAAWKRTETAYGGLTDAQLKAKLLKQYKEGATAATLDDLAEGGIGCTMSGDGRGDLPWNTMKELLELLGLHYEEAAEADWKKKVNLEAPGLLGLLINKGSWHYVAVPKFSTRRDCKPWQYVFAESFGHGPENKILTCHGKRDLYRLIEGLPPTRLFMVSAVPGSYRAEAIVRMEKRMGRKTYTRKAAVAKA
jgi:hypothetical protein